MKAGARQVKTAAPVAIGAANALGTSDSLPLADHVHAHGAQTDPNMHALATVAVAGFFSPTEKQQLAALVAGSGSVPLQVAYASTVTLNLANNSSFAIGPLTGNITIGFSNPTHGVNGRIVTLNDSTGERSTAWAAAPSGWSIAWLTKFAPITDPSTFVMYAYQCVTIGVTSAIVIEQLGQVNVPRNLVTYSGGYVLNGGNYVGYTP